MKKTYSIPICKMMVFKSEPLMNNTVYGEPEIIGSIDDEDDGMGWGGGHAGGDTDADSNKSVWDE